MFVWWSCGQMGPCGRRRVKKDLSIMARHAQTIEQVVDAGRAGLVVCSDDVRAM